MGRKPSDRDLENELERLREERRAALGASEGDGDGNGEGERSQVPLSDRQRRHIAETFDLPIEQVLEAYHAGTPDPAPIGDRLSPDQQAALDQVTGGEGGDDPR